MDRTGKLDTAAGAEFLISALRRMAALHPTQSSAGKMWDGKVRPKAELRRDLPHLLRVQHSNTLWAPFDHTECRLAGREWHVVGDDWLGETLQGERANLFGCDGPF